MTNRALSNICYAQALCAVLLRRESHSSFGSFVHHAARFAGLGALNRTGCEHLHAGADAHHGLDALLQMSADLRDLIGTGLFASEYVVASKAFGNLDLSLGLAWGYLGSRGQFRNPLGLVSSRFDERPVIHSESGGTLNSKGYFRGRTALFGGIQYQLPSHPSWLLKLEYDGNDYRSPTDRGNIQAASPWNVGVVYRARSWLDLTVGFERGNQIMFGFSLHERMNRLDMIKFLDPPRVPVRPVGVASGQAHSVSDTVAELERQAGAAVKRMHGGDVRWTLVLDGADRGDQRPLVDKVVAVAHRDAPATVQTIRVALEERGVPVAEVAVDRTRWARERTEFLRPSERQTDRVTRPVAAGDPARQPGNLYDRDAAGLWQRGRAGLGLNYTQSLGGPDGLLFSLGAVAQGEYRLRDDLWATGPQPRFRAEGGAWPSDGGASSSAGLTAGARPTNKQYWEADPPHE